MNRKGQTIMLSILFGIFIYLFGIVFINFLMPDVTTARTALSCSNGAAISDGTKLMCLVVDVVVIYWILLIISIAGGVMFSKILT